MLNHVVIVSSNANNGTNAGSFILNSNNDLSRIMSYKGWMKRCNAKKLWRSNTQKLVKLFPKQLKAAI